PVLEDMIDPIAIIVRGPEATICMPWGTDLALGPGEHRDGLHGPPVMIQYPIIILEHPHTKLFIASALYLGMYQYTLLRPVPPPALGQQVRDPPSTAGFPTGDDGQKFLVQEFDALAQIEDLVGRWIEKPQEVREKILEDPLEQFVVDPAGHFYCCR